MGYNEEMFKELDKRMSGDEYPWINIDPEGSTISIKIQDGPVKMHDSNGIIGINGAQIDNLGKMWLEILKIFNEKYPCRENSISIRKIQEALFWQDERTKDRIKRNVEGINKK